MRTRAVRPVGAVFCRVAGQDCYCVTARKTRNSDRRQENRRAEISGQKRAVHSSKSYLKGDKRVNGNDTSYKRFAVMDILEAATSVVRCELDAMEVDADDEVFHDDVATTV